MKECTYGWYPPAKDIWKHYRDNPNTYEEECRYKHHKSRYTSHPGVATPVPPGHIQLEISPQHDTPVTSRPPTGQNPRSSNGSYTVRRIRPTPRKAWSSYVPQTSMVPQPPSVSRDTANSPEPTTQHPQRVQSAHSHRPRISPKPRPVKSAGPIRTPSVQQRSASADSIRLRKSASASNLQNAQRPQHHTPKRPQSCTSERQHTPQRPQSCTIERAHTTTPEPCIEVRSPSPVDGYRTPSPIPAPMQWRVYENQLREYGWKMEIPGDPLNLKRPCISKRLPYTSKVSIPEVEPEGPGVHMVNYDTYFYNTIPRRRATFDIAKDWASEVLHAKRMELQKRDGGIKYKYKNFSFVY